jgi:hypothetical protein
VECSHANALRHGASFPAAILCGRRFVDAEGCRIAISNPGAISRSDSM